MNNDFTHKRCVELIAYVLEREFHSRTDGKTELDSDDYRFRPLSIKERVALHETICQFPLEAIHQVDVDLVVAIIRKLKALGFDSGVADFCAKDWYNLRKEDERELQLLLSWRTAAWQYWR